MREQIEASTSSPAVATPQAFELLKTGLFNEIPSPRGKKPFKFCPTN